ncbi:TPA: archaeal proteasome endopeptidase complex subunit alpha, partial [Candidatus Bathyarchaeota archaeon]|nr:archaeal proteasome endopeptidase complex subunit alpha [Candidatus Bathyarchaeota archaeon]
MIVPGAYDRAITVFSPDGRLFQVEYATEVVRKGSLIVGAKCPEGVVLAAREEKGKELIDPQFSWKIAEVDAHIGVAFAGLSSDAQRLIHQARIYAQSNRLMYDEPIDVEVIAKRIGSLMQLYTQHAGVRPFGVSLMFGGVDRAGCRLFVTGPSGSYRGYQAFSIGSGSDQARGILRKKYRPGMTLDETL